MSTIAGPRVQMPQAIGDPLAVEKNEDGSVGRIYWRQDWPSFYSALQQITFNVSRSGPTASRPTSTTPNRFVGMPFFDTDLGLPIFLKTASSNAWVKADGTGA